METPCDGNPLSCNGNPLPFMETIFEKQGIIIYGNQCLHV
jgi:hypothetical protein